MWNALATLKASDWVLAIAALAGPVFAVQAQKWVERWREVQKQKMWIFTTLMSTRAARLTSEHVRALNLIDLAFYGVRRLGIRNRSNTEQAVLDKWKEYLDDLTEPWDATVNNEIRIERRADLFVQLLECIGTDVRYKFDRVQLKKGAYQPIAHNTEDEEQQELRRAVIDVFKGTKNLKMDLERFPLNEAATKGMMELHGKLNEALEGKRELSVKIKGSGELKS